MYLHFPHNQTINTLEIFWSFIFNLKINLIGLHSAIEFFEVSIQVIFKPLFFSLKMLKAAEIFQQTKNEEEFHPTKN